MPTKPLDNSLISNDLHYCGITTKPFLTDGGWYKIKAGAVIEIEPVNSNGATVQNQAKLFKTLDDMVIQLGISQKPIGLEEIKKL